VSTQVELLINEVRLLYQSMLQVGESIHTGSGISMGMRAVLEFLDRNGATTVPDIARARRVSRQRIQTLVNPLVEMKLIVVAANPASKRSPLMALTPAGSRRILDMRKLEGKRFQNKLPDQQLQDATATLARLRAALEDEG
jgi:DNA-binding MarR family transcriptional regulator